MVAGVGNPLASRRKIIACRCDQMSPGHCQRPIAAYGSLFTDAFRPRWP